MQKTLIDKINKQQFHLVKISQIKIAIVVINIAIKIIRSSRLTPHNILRNPILDPQNLNPKIITLKIEGNYQQWFDTTLNRNN